MCNEHDIRSRVESLGVRFQSIKPIKTSFQGADRETWLLEYEDSQFVYVPGQKNVTLGWDPSKCPLGDGVLEGLRQEFSSGHEYYYGEELEDLKGDYQDQIAEAEKAGDSAKAAELRAELAEELKQWNEDIEEKGYATWEGFLTKWNVHLTQCLSPLRTADIGDMIAEVDSCYLEEDAPSLEQAVRSLKKGPFTLPTEDEWEYLCNGGARTLFRWGNTLRGVAQEIYQVGAVGRAKENTILEQPNMLGLFIAYNSYKNEIIDNLSYTKGGDGGCSLCGGDGAIYVLPCYTAFYRQPVNQRYSSLSKNFYAYRRILRLP